MLLILSLNFRIKSAFALNACGESVKQYSVLITLIKKQQKLEGIPPAPLPTWSHIGSFPTSDSSSSSYQVSKYRILDQYSWLDRKYSVKIWIKCPGIRKLQQHLKLKNPNSDTSDNIYANFRAKSFDVAVHDDQGILEAARNSIKMNSSNIDTNTNNVFTFSVSELPMEIVPLKCSVKVNEDTSSETADELQVILKKEVQTSWFKLQVHH